MRAIETLADIPEMQAAARPGEEAIVCENRRVTYGDLDARSRQAAAMLATFGVRPGHRVAWLGRSHEAFFELLFGAAMVGACFTPINNRLAPPEIAVILEDCSADLLFVTADQLGLVVTVISRVPRWIEVVLVDAARTPYADYRALREAATGVATSMARADRDVLQLYTSGTTGLPKGVRLTNANLAAFLKTGRTYEGFDFGVDDTLLGVVPLFHVGGVNPSLSALVGGSRLVLMPVFDPGLLLRTIEAERATRIGFVPAMLGMVLQHPDCARIDASTVRTLTYGGSPISEAVLDAAAARFGCGIMQMYGMTESCATGTILTVGDHADRRIRSCGQPWPDHEVRVVNGEGREAGRGEVGEIQIRGPGVMAGYWNRPEATAEAITVDGWLNTGDAGYRDVDGYFYVHDRVKDMIVSGGENVYPAEVENAIMGCPGVAEAAVIGVPDPRWGEAVKAVVTLAPGAEANETHVIAWVRDRIAGYKTPKTVDFVEVLPRNGTGKVLRRVLREPYWEGCERRVG